jgi:hypothetical protein
MRLALTVPAPAATSAPMSWQERERGFEADRILLARIDPARYRFVVRNAPAGDKDIDEWSALPGTRLIVNGGYSGFHRKLAWLSC